MNASGPLIGFKFGKRIFIEKAMRTGKVRMGTLEDFRRADHPQRISDPDEGTKTLFFSGAHKFKGDDLARQYGLPISGPGTVMLHNSTFKLVERDAFIYSITSELFNSSVFDMLEKSEYDACMMITDVEAFCFELAKSLEQRYPQKKFYFEAGYCEYGSRQHTVEAGMEPSDRFQNQRSVFSKDETNSSQREFRLVAHSDDIKPINNLKSLHIRKYLIPVEFIGITNLRFAVLGNLRIGVKTHLRNGRVATFSIKQPCEMFTPISFWSGSKRMLGYRSESKTQTFDSPTLANSEIGITIDAGGPIFGAVPLADVVKISFFSEQGG